MIKTAFSQNRFVVLFCSLVALLVGTPIVRLITPGAYPKLATIAMLILFTWVLLSAAFAVTKTRTSIVTAIGLALPIVVFNALYLWLEHTKFLLFYHLFGLVFLGYVIAVIFKALFKDQKVTVNTISAALCIYLLFGVIWAMGYSLIELLSPGAFSMTEGSEQLIMNFGGRDSSFALYYSFVTMSTLGYGDIVPKLIVARMLAASEAITGQLYLAVLVARLVGLYTTQRGQACHSAIRFKSPNLS